MRKSRGVVSGGGLGRARGADEAIPTLNVNQPSKGLGEITTDFAQVVYDNLSASGVQNTKKGEAIKFEWLRPRASRSGLVPFEGRYLEGEVVKRAAICIGPEYDTVGYDLVKARRARGGGPLRHPDRLRFRLRARGG